MEAVVGLVIMLLQVCHGVETHCDGRRDGALCHGALGGSVFLQLMDDASEVPRYEWRKGDRTLLKGKKSTVTTSNIDGLFSPSNGTVKINNLNRSDGGIYNLTIRGEDGKPTGQRSLNLSIQAPVTSVHLTSHCLPLGEKRVSCSSVGGDSPQYRWTLDGRTLTDDELVPDTNDTDSMTLKLEVVGHLVCWVHNHISNASGKVELTTCDFMFINCTSSNGTEISEWVHKDSFNPCVHLTTVSTTSVGTLLVLAGVLAALVILIVVAFAVAYALKKKKDNKTKEEEEDVDLTYADVRIVQQQRRRVELRSDERVEYGQVKFSERPRQTEAKADECIYSQVKMAR
ncbi:unnamed protein product [Ophioblennius macclurei]